MFIEDFFKNDDEGRKINKFARESCTYNAMYVFWRDNLFERVMRLFVWENTDPVPPKEIEQRLILRGHCGVLPFEGELTAFFGSFYGVTKYNDEKKFYNYRCPLYSNHAEIGKEIAIINNNALRNPVYPLVHHYAMLLAHNEVTIINTMINARDADGVPIAHTEKQKQSIQQYQSQRFNGQYGVVTDIGNLGVEYVDSDRKTVITLGDLIDTRARLLKSFYSDIGVRSAFEKRSNTVESEVEADTSLLLLNISDMIDARERGAKEVNRLFGTNWSVHIAEEIDYATENERIQFSGTDIIHEYKGGNDNGKDSE